MSERQETNQPIDVTHWRRDEDFAQYPEGARDKSLVYCPMPPPYDFLKANHRYLFKLSSSRGKEQFWVEIIAYRLGVEMDILVPPAFIAFDSKENQCGALIEWFYDTSSEDYIAGGDYCQQLIPDFERKKGWQHNFETIAQIFEGLKITDWKVYWSKALVFDALIGNTDRHQDNWGVIESFEYKEEKRIVKNMRISPVFDNGTSLGYEVLASNFKNYDDATRFQRYVTKGKHHLRWALNDSDRIGHAEMVRKIAAVYPEMRAIMMDCLGKVTAEIFKKILAALVEFDVPVKLTPERSTFMLKLLTLRHHRLLNELETQHAIY